MNQATPTNPWYREPWFWFLTIFPLAAIVWCGVMIAVALNMEDSMVTDDYSKQGRGINLEIARDQKAAELGLEANFQFNAREVRLTLDTHKGPAEFPYLVLNLFHPTLADRDRTIQFQRMVDGSYKGQLSRDIEGRWYFDLRGPGNEWRLKGETFLPSATSLTLAAGPEGRG